MKVDATKEYQDPQCGKKLILMKNQAICIDGQELSTMLLAVSSEWCTYQ